MIRNGVDGSGSAGRRSRALALVSCALALCLGMVGCADNAQQTMAMLEAENQEYLDANEQLKRELATAMEQRSQLVGQNHELINENAQLRDQLAGIEITATDPWNIEGVTGASRAGEIVAQVAGDVLFTSGSVELRDEAKATLDQIAQVLRSSFSPNYIRIAGFTDNDPIRKSDWKTNERLSCERAMAVKAYLETKGVAGDRMYVAGYGENRPLANKEASRRVEIVVLATE